VIEPSPLTGDPEFLKLWTGQTVSDVGDQITLLAIPLTAVIVLHAGPLEMGLLGAVATAPTALLSLPVGVWVDRVPRRQVLLAADGGRATVLASVPVAFALGVLGLPHLYLAAFLTGTLSVFFVVAYQAYLPGLVGRDKLVDANSKMLASASVAQLAGPSVAGVLVQLFTAPMSVVGDAMSFLASFIGLSLTRRPEPPLAPRRRDMVAEIREGLSALLGQPILRTLVICASIFVLLMSAQNAILLLYFSRELGLSPAVIGLILGVGGVGALGGAVLAGPLGRWLGIGPSFIVGAFLAIGGLLFVRGLVGGSTVAIVISLAVGQLIGLFGGSLLSVNGPSLRQALTAAHLLGRVNASYRFLAWGTGPLGALLGGLLGEILGLRSALLITALASLSVLLIAVTSQLPKIREMPTSTAA